jgi:hypothetical protein
MSGTIIITLDKDRNISKVEGIDPATKVMIRRPTEKAEPEEPKLQWFSCVWFVLAGRSYVKCFNEAEARQIAVEHADTSDQEGGIIYLEEGRKVKHDWYNTPDEQPYIESVDQDEDSLQRGAGLDREEP